MRKYQKDSINVPAIIAKRLLYLSILMSLIVAFISIMISWAAQ
jgi:hypothetical protein